MTPHRWLWIEAMDSCLKEKYNCHSFPTQTAVRNPISNKNNSQLLTFYGNRLFSGYGISLYIRTALKQHEGFASLLLLWTRNPRFKVFGDMSKVSQLTRVRMVTYRWSDRALCRMMGASMDSNADDLILGVCWCAGSCMNSLQLSQRKITNVLCITLSGCTCTAGS